MKKTIDKTIQIASDKIHHPFLGTFIFSWVLWNWKSLLFVIFSTKDMESKIDLLEHSFFNWYTYLILPIISSFLLITILPWIQRLLDWINSQSKRSRMEFSNQQKIKELKSLVDVTKEEQKLKVYQAGYDFDKYEKELQQIHNTLNRHDSEMNSISKTSTSIIKFVDNNLKDFDLLIHDLTKNIQTLQLEENSTTKRIVKNLQNMSLTINKIKIKSEQQELNLKKKEDEYQKNAVLTSNAISLKLTRVN